ncbi:hypothetical protein N9L76_04630 [bacterium]|nr:hypothetical protein [bacterium]
MSHGRPSTTQRASSERRGHGGKRVVRKVKGATCGEASSGVRAGDRVDPQSSGNPQQDHDLVDLNCHESSKTK